MCCFLTTLWLLGPRFGFLIYWLIPYGRLKIYAAFNTWFWPLLGLIFPAMGHFDVHDLYRPGGLMGFDWLWLGLAFVADISAYGASAARRRDASWYTGP